MVKFSEEEENINMTSCCARIIGVSHRMGFTTYSTKTSIYTTGQKTLPCPCCQRCIEWTKNLSKQKSYQCGREWASLIFSFLHCLGVPKPICNLEENGAFFPVEHQNHSGKSSRYFCSMISKQLSLEISLNMLERSSEMKQRDRAWSFFSFFVMYSLIASWEAFRTKSIPLSIPTAKL